MSGRPPPSCSAKPVFNIAFNSGCFTEYFCRIKPANENECPLRQGRCLGCQKSSTQKEKQIFKSAILPPQECRRCAISKLPKLHPHSVVQPQTAFECAQVGDGFPLQVFVEFGCRLLCHARLS